MKRFTKYLVLVAIMMLAISSTAYAAVEIPSGSFVFGYISVRQTPAPTAVPEATPIPTDHLEFDAGEQGPEAITAIEPDQGEAEQIVISELGTIVVETPAPTAAARIPSVSVVRVTPMPMIAVEEVEEEEEIIYSYELDKDGKLVLDDLGNPKPIDIPEGAEIPVNWKRDENGELILDKNGKPIVTDTVPQGATLIQTIQDEDVEFRRIEIYVSYDNEDLAIGDEVTLTAVAVGYDDIDYELQWQNSIDDEYWDDIPEANEQRYVFTLTEENNYYFWRVQLYVTVEVAANLL